MIARVFLFCLMALQVPLFSASAQAEVQWEAGKHYTVLPYPVRTRDASKVEVVELFWYGCPHCYRFNPVIHAWEKSAPEYVDFWLSPATFSKVWKTHARAFYTAELLGVLDASHQAMFDAVVRDRKKLEDEDSLAKFYAGFGVSEADFKKTFNSFAVNAKLQQADARVRSYRATGVPAIVVNGKYLVSSSTAGGQDNILKVVNFLVEQEKQGLSAATE